MTKPSDTRLSAQVLLKTASGEAPQDADLTSARLASVVPPASVVAAITRSLASAGFEVGPFVGLSVSIAGPRSLFESVFGLTAAELKGGEIPLRRLPADIRSGVAAIVFPPPPDFGPGSYS